MVKLNETIRFRKNIYLLESKNNNEYLLSDKNKVKSWIDSNFIKSNIELIKFRKPINISESFKALNEKSLNNSLIFENDYVKIIAKSILDEHFGGQIFYHGSHSNNITDFRVPAFWSTSVDFSTSYGNWIYRAQLDLGNCFDLNIKKHFNWLLTKLDFNLLFIDDEDIEHNLHTFEEYKKLASNNNWGIVEHHLDIITKHFDSAKITEQGTTNFIVFDNSRIKLLGKPTQRNLDETKIIIYTPENKYIRIYNEYKTDAIKSFLKEFKYYNYITPEKLKKNGFLEESLFYATQWKDEQGDDVFFTNQIKAVNNNGNYSLNSNNIYESLNSNSNFKLLNENSLGQPIANDEESLKKFYDWFGNSKVVDKQGRPLVVYHGGGRFDTFRYSYDGTYYFTTNKEYAERYAKDYIDEKERKGLGELKAVYLNIKNPAPQDVMDRNTLDQVIAQGYDGHIFEDILSEKDDKIIRVFNPNQIKSINNDTWNPNSNNIYESTFYGNVNWQNNMAALGNVPATIGHNLFATMFPNQFLKLCPPYSYGEDDWFDKQLNERIPYGIPFLKVDVDEKNKQLIVTNHEGRHRVASVYRKEPNVDIPVAILYNKDRYTLPDINTLRKEWSIISQDGKSKFNVGKFSLYNELPKQATHDLYDIYKNKQINENKRDINWQDNVRDVYGEIFYKTLQLIIDNDIIGYVDYNVYENEVYVEYIYVEPKWRRSMYGTKIIQKLQSLYPNTEINFGMMTDDGSKLYQSLNKNIVKNDEYIDKVNRLQKILNWLNKYEAVTNKNPDDWSEAEIEYIKKYEPIWRKYYDKKNDIEDWLSNNKESKSFIKY